MVQAMAELLAPDAFVRAKDSLVLTDLPLERLAAIDRLMAAANDAQLLNGLAVSGLLALRAIYKLSVVPDAVELAPSEVDVPIEARLTALAALAGHVLPEASVGPLRNDEARDAISITVSFTGTTLPSVSLPLRIARRPLALGALVGTGMPFDLQLGNRYELPFAWAEELIALCFRAGRQTKDAVYFECLRELRLRYKDEVKEALKRVVPGLLWEELSEHFKEFVREVLAAFRSGQYQGFPPDYYPTNYTPPNERDVTESEDWLNETLVDLVERCPARPQGPLPWPGGK